VATEKGGKEIKKELQYQQRKGIGNRKHMKKEGVDF
jgi:hypothetical protein